jgi:hypothetical protein
MSKKCQSLTAICMLEAWELGSALLLLIPANPIYICEKRIIFTIENLNK